MVVNSIIEKAFDERPDLKKRTYEAIAQSPHHTALFNDIATYTQTLRSSNPISLPNGEPPPSKKRKLDDSSSTNGTPRASPPEWKKGYYTVPDMSFAVPQRKKFTLEISESPLEGLRARNATTGAIEFGLAWKDVQHVVCVPVPDKAQRKYTFCVFPTYGDGVTVPPEGTLPVEPMVWTVPDAVPKNVALGKDKDIEAVLDGSYKDYVLRILNSSLGLVGKKVIGPEEREFASTLVQAHRKGEKAFHVGAFRGSKDGFLFFLSTGILYAFKKPLLFFPFDAIDSVSYTSVLQRTFNLNITTLPSSSTSKIATTEDEKQEFEFSMLDQADFAGIDTYVKRHALQDASMAEQRRAKRLNVNGAKAGHGDGEGEEEEGEGELAKAEKEVAAADGDMQENDEDEEEGEDYDPGSEGQSEGSGSSTEEEDLGHGHGEEAVGEIGDELGSEGEEEQEL
ncbi:hypothetical protein MMC16_003893 [Acarospora aff. strigata]|nr:hypothetical protein [Acarospora aff. strigata]